MLESPSKANIVMKIASVSVAIVFAGLTLYAFSQKAPLHTVTILTAISLLGIYMLAFLLGSTILINEQSVTSKTLHGKYQINWDEITEIEKTIFGYSFILSGKNKCLSFDLIFAPKNWQQVVAAIESHANKIGIKIKSTLVCKRNINTNI